MADQSERTQDDREVNGRDGEAVSLELPVDIIPGILDRLPAKSLLRFKCLQALAFHHIGRTESTF